MELSHIDEKGDAIMVDISAKNPTAREAVACGKIYMQRRTLALVVSGDMPKGDVMAVARVAGIMAAKRTHELIPMCHSIPLDSVKLELAVNLDELCIDIKGAVKCIWKTGVEMEALTAVTIAGLTLYDMCKAVDKTMVIGNVRLIKKSGGKSAI